jgi:hypothetical protein
MKSIDKKTNIDPNDIVRAVNKKIGEGKVTTGINWDNVSPIKLMPAIDASQSVLIASKKLCEILAPNRDYFNLAIFEAAEGVKYIGIEQNPEFASIPFFRKHVAMESAMPVTEDLDHRTAVLQMIAKMRDFAKNSHRGILTVKTSEPQEVQIGNYTYTLYKINPRQRNEK